MQTVLEIAKWGNSLAVRLPAALAEKLGVIDGGEVALRARPVAPVPGQTASGPGFGEPGFSEEVQASYGTDDAVMHRVIVGKWGNSAAVRLPRALVTELGVQNGERIMLREGEGAVLEIARELSVDELFARVRALRGMIPADFAFNREEANSRVPHERD